MWRCISMIRKYYHVIFHMYFTYVCCVYPLYFQCISIAFPSRVSSISNVFPSHFLPEAVTFPMYFHNVSYPRQLHFQTFPRPISYNFPLLEMTGTYFQCISYALHRAISTIFPLHGISRPEWTFACSICIACTAYVRGRLIYLWACKWHTNVWARHYLHGWGQHWHKPCRLPWTEKGVKMSRHCAIWSERRFAPLRPEPRAAAVFVW